MGIFDDDFANGHLPAKVRRVACQRVCNPMNAFFEPGSRQETHLFCAWPAPSGPVCLLVSADLAAAGVSVFACSCVTVSRDSRPELDPVPLRTTQELRPARREADEAPPELPVRRAAKLRPGISASGGGGIAVGVHGCSAATASFGSW